MTIKESDLENIFNFRMEGFKTGPLAQLREWKENQVFNKKVYL